MTQVQYTSSDTALSLKGNLHALARVAWDQKLISDDDFLDLTIFAPPEYEVVELLHCVIARNQPDALVFLRRALEASRVRAQANKQGFWS